MNSTEMNNYLKNNRTKSMSDLHTYIAILLEPWVVHMAA